MVSLLAAMVLAGPPEIMHGLRDRTPVITYHDMVERRGPGTLWFDCALDEFTAQLDWLQRQGAHFITIEQLYKHLTTGAKLPPHAFAITFADNYEGFYRLALPVLRKRHIPVAMLVHTDYVGSRVGRPKMDWAQLRELDQEGLVTVASQTRTHPADLRTLKQAALDEEMAGSKFALERQFGHPCPYIAYPNGKFDARVAKAARKAGYVMAFTERLTPAERSPSIWMVSRYVHTKYRQAWGDAYGH